MTLSAESGSFLYDQVAAWIQQLISSGALQPGERVPSLRKASRQHKVSIATVMQAYVALEDRGLIEARPQSGYYVCEHNRVEPSVPKRTNPSATPRRVKLGDMVGTILSSAQEPGVVPLGVANAAPELLPVKALTRALNKVAIRRANEGVNYCTPPGDAELRRQIARLSMASGCALDPGEIVITSGATEALALCLQSVAQPGDVIAVESPTYFILLQLIERLGMLAVEIPSEPDTGMCLDSLQSVLDKVKVKAVMTVANFNNPYGSLMPDDTKERLVELLMRRRIPLIDDDIYGDLHFGPERPRALKSFDRDGWVLSCSSFSKTLAPGYRVGWTAPGRYYDAVLSAKQLTSSASASLPQFAVAEFVGSGAYERHLQRLRRAYREQVERVRQAIGQYFPPGTRVSRPQGGFVLWVEMPRGVDCITVFQQALAEGISLTPGILFSPTQKYKNCIRISCGYPWSPAFEAAIRRLGELAAAMSAE